MAQPPASRMKDLDSLHSPRALRHWDEGVRLAAAVARARRGDRSGLSTVWELIFAENGASVFFSALSFVGSIATEPELVDMVAALRRHIEPEWGQQESIARVLYHSRLLWTVPIILRCYQRMCVARPPNSKDAPILLAWVDDLIYPPWTKPYGRSLSAWHYAGVPDYLVAPRIGLEGWREVRARCADDHVPLFFGEPGDMRVMATSIRDQTEHHWGLNYREIYESITGADCSTWYGGPGNRKQRLQIKGEMERFLAADVEDYAPGKRYFLGHEVPRVSDPRAIELMNEALAYLDHHIATIPRETLIDLHLVDDDEDEDDDPGHADYIYAEIDDWRADPNGSADERVASVAHEAVLGDFHRAVDRILEAAALDSMRLFDPDAHEFDWWAGNMLGDLGPSAQLRRLVELPSQRREPRWRELSILALSASGLAWALEAAGELMCGLDPDETRFGPPPRSLRREQRRALGCLSEEHPVNGLREPHRRPIPARRVDLGPQLEALPIQQCIEPAVEFVELGAGRRARGHRWELPPPSVPTRVRQPAPRI